MSRKVEQPIKVAATGIFCVVLLKATISLDHTLDFRGAISNLEGPHFVRHTTLILCSGMHEFLSDFKNSMIFVSQTTHKENL